MWALSIACNTHCHPYTLFSMDNLVLMYRVVLTTAQFTRDQGRSCPFISQIWRRITCV